MGSSICHNGTGCHRRFGSGRGHPETSVCSVFLLHQSEEDFVHVYVFGLTYRKYHHVLQKSRRE
jgi:hypothetical protein